MWNNPVKLRKDAYFQCLWNISLLTDNPDFQMHAFKFESPTGAPHNGTSAVWDFQIIKHMLKQNQVIVLHFLCHWSSTCWITLWGIKLHVQNSIYFNPSTWSLISVSLQFKDLKFVKLVTTKLFSVHRDGLGHVLCS